MNTNLTTSPNLYGLLQVSGQDAAKFLQGQLTCDISTLNPGTSKLAAHCNAQGRVLFLMRIFYFSHAYYLIMPNSIMSISLLHFNKYTIFYQVILKIISNPSDIEHNLANKEWDFFNIKCGIPQIYPETSNKFLPHELNLPQLGAISWNKGCYTGQEIIARIHYRGKLKTQLYQATVTSLIPPVRGMILQGCTKSAVVDYDKIGENDYYMLILSPINTEKNCLFLYDQTQEHWKWI